MIIDLTHVGTGVRGCSVSSRDDKVRPLNIVCFEKLHHPRRNISTYRLDKIFVSPANSGNRTISIDYNPHLPGVTIFYPAIQAIPKPNNVNMANGVRAKSFEKMLGDFPRRFHVN
jgi:hypothetical protein